MAGREFNVWIYNFHKKTAVNNQFLKILFFREIKKCVSVTKANLNSDG